MTLQTQRVQTLEQVRRVAEGNEPVDFALADRTSAYDFIRRTLVQFDYSALGKADKGAVKAYLGKMTGQGVRLCMAVVPSEELDTGRQPVLDVGIVHAGPVPCSVDGGGIRMSPHSSLRRVPASGAAVATMRRARRPR